MESQIKKEAREEVNLPKKFYAIERLSNNLSLRKRKIRCK